MSKQSDTKSTADKKDTGWVVRLFTQSGAGQSASA